MNLDAAPIDLGLLPAFLTAVALVELTPGPNMGYLAILAASRGRAAGLAAIVGVTAGLGLYMVAAAAGVTEALLAYPALLHGLRWLGVGYLLWLAFEAWRGAGETSPGHAGLPDGRDHAWRGFLANVLNPKAAVFYLFLLPGFIADDHAPPFVQALLFGCVHLGVSVGVHTAIVLFAARAGASVQAGLDPVRLQRLRRLFAVALAGTAAWLALEALY
ncbi:MAG: LysE family translocator [Caulobacteraceae bacterium]|nr:LysE family translocator [Caulobacteraceae bacterium]